jgi:hypothetical protein
MTIPPITHIFLETLANRTMDGRMTQSRPTLYYDILENHDEVLREDQRTHSAVCKVFQKQLYHVETAGQCHQPSTRYQRSARSHFLLCNKDVFITSR